MNLQHEILIKGDAAKVWKTLTTPEGTRKVYFGSTIQSTFKAGAHLTYTGPGRDGQDTVHIQGKILEFNAPHVFSHTSQVGAAYGDEHRHFVSRVTYKLEPVSEGVLLNLTHDQWTEGDPSYENTKAGWDMILAGLKSVVETGNPLEANVTGHA